MTLKDLEDMDVAVEYPLTMFDEEKFVVANGELVGTTATISEESITHIPGLQLEGYSSSSRLFMNCDSIVFRVDPDFDTDKNGILAASKATCLLVNESWDAQDHLTWEFATAFFIGRTWLLTAGHAALDPPDAVKIDRYLFLPGTPYLSIDTISKKHPHAIRYKVIDNMYRKGDPKTKDIALISSGTFETQHYLQLSLDRVAIDETIDIVGYPGEKKSNWLREKHPTLRSFEEAAKTSENFLPTRRLIVTRGKVAHNDRDMTSYHISTCPGLSGAGLIYKGVAHGFDVFMLR